ncbi:uncharacterized protein LOC130672188 [Microplitis mediator]|uniref:uncharacterized protein LOC130672188 n=1 Tax=Microplitis mediator TaxID=375433 RepID=UPI002556E059|nr:uncharacterized protein LOC130672188 [Microplitis mediator]
MEDDSESSCDERIEDLTKTKKFEFPHNSTKSLDSGTNLEPYTISIKPLQKFSSGVSYEINKSLSSQVMEYYHKYSQNSNLNRFFSLPNANAERHGYSWKARDQIIPRSRQTVASSNENKTVSVLDAPKERRKWTRPPLIGQLSGSSGNVIPSSYIERISSEPRTSVETPVKTDTFLETEGTENSQRLDKSVNSNFETIDRDLKILSPSSSNTSHKPLEWDSWADVGYNNVLSLTEKESLNMIRTVEQKVSTQSLCSTSFRLDPEGTTASNVESFNDKTNNSLLKTRQHSSEPDAHSTRLTDGILDSDEIKITPIIKTSHSNIIVGDVTGNKDVSLKSDVPTKKDEESPASNVEEIDKSKISDAGKSNPSQKNISVDDIIITPIIDSSKRSISELDLRKIISNDYKELSVPFKFQSSSSFAVKNKPILCDKSIQINSTPEYGYKQKLKGTKISSTADLDESKKVNAEEKVKNWQTELPDEINKPTNERFLIKEEMNPLKSPQSISEYEVKANATKYSKTKGEIQNMNENFHSENQEKTEGGRTSNSFEYFPGHTFRNFSHGDNASRTSSFESERSCSTMPNTSSSLDEKLWGHSDSLLHDLERSLTILRSLVNANKCDKQVKKRLIHHVIKRLVTAKYTDDKIEYKLEDNVPWNPDNARNKIYCTEMIQAFAKKRNQQNSTEESSEDSKLNKRVFPSNCKNQGNREIKGKNQFVNSESSDNFEERNTDRTDYMLDGRKARMGLRNDKRRLHHYRHNQSNHQKDSEVFDVDKYESSDSFLPQLKNLNYKEKLMIKSLNGMREISSAPTATTTSARIIQNSTSTATTTITTTPNASINSTVITTATTTNTITTTNTTTPISINSSLKNLKKQSEIERNIGREKIDWRLPSTMSERRFADEWCTSRIASATRLIDYVEVEKKNQLMWINSEINHLSSLKKLLEESVKSIKKNENDYSREELLLNIEEKSKRLGENLPKSEYFKNKPWSSHGNLVEKCNENYKVSERQNGHEKHGSNDATKNELSDRVQTARSQLAGVSSSSPEVFQHEEVKSDEHKCNRRPLTSEAKQSTDDQTSRGSQSQIGSKKETKNRLNDQCKSDFVGENEERIDKTKCCHKCCHKNVERERNSEDDQRQSQKKRSEDKEKGKKSVKANQTILCEDCKTFHCKINPNLSGNSIYIKPIAYELSFEKKNVKKGSNVNQSYENTSNSPGSPKSDSGDNSHCDSIQFHLKDYLKKNKPKFVDNVEMRKRYISEISQLRLLKKKNRMQLLVNDQVSNLAVNQKPKLSTKSLRKIGDDEMKMRLRLRHLRLNEIRSKRKQQEKDERVRRNHLMAKIFCKKLQQKVLNGQVDLSQSSSVISNL